MYANFRLVSYIANIPFWGQSGHALLQFMSLTQSGHRLPLSQSWFEPVR
jgi:hypothetical protein